MTFKEFKNTETYQTANILDVYSEETRIEYPDDFPEEKLDEMDVTHYSSYGGWLSVTLQS